MRFASLFLVFVLTKLIMVWGHTAPVTEWTLAAYVWQDAMVALAFGAFDIAMQRIGTPTRIVWAFYWALAIYTVINIPVGRVLSTPLTRPMLRAARGPLADSILVYLTASNILLVASFLAAAACLPWLMGRLPRQFARSSVVCAIVVVLIGPAASSRVDTRGMDRNVVTALIDTGLPRVVAAAGATQWRESRFAAAGPEDLSRFRGTAQGFNLVMVSL